MSAYGTSIVQDDTGNVYITGVSGFNYSILPDSINYQDLQGEAFLIKLNQEGDLIWNINLPGMSIISLDRFNNIQVTGLIDVPNFDYDPGPESQIIGINNPDVNIFFARYTNAGVLSWVTGIYAERNDFFSAYTNYGIPFIDQVVDSLGNTYATGLFIGRLSAITENGFEIFNSGEQNFSDSQSYIIKISPFGEILWLRNTVNQELLSIQPTYGFTITEIHLLHNGELLISAETRNIVDLNFDVDSAILFNENSNYLYSSVFLQIDNDCNYVNHYSVGGSVRASHIDKDGNLIFSGLASPDSDFDFGPDTLTYPFTYGLYFASYNSNLQLNWIKPIDAAGVYNVNVIKKITSDSYGNYFFTGKSGDIDFNPGPEVENGYTDLNEANYFIAKWDKEGNYMWSHKFENYYQSEFMNLFSFYGTDLNVNLAGDIAITGGFGFPVSLNPLDENSIYSPNYVPNQDTLRTDAFFQKFNQNECENFKVLISNIQSVGCNQPGLLSLETIHFSGSPSYQWESSDSDSSMALFNQLGFKQVTVSADTCSAEYNFYLPGPESSNQFELSGNLYFNDFAPGSESIVKISARNSGCIPSDGVLSIEYDSLLNFENAIPAPSAINQNMVSWNFQELVYGTTLNVSDIFFETNLNASASDSISLLLEILPLVNDAIPENNNLNYSIPLFDSTKPNRKMVSPTGVCEDNYIDLSQSVQTTISFQNTGNNTILDLVVIDTIPNGFYASDFRTIESSHNYTVELLNERVLKFVFNQILLPDSSTDFNLSRGYITYEYIPLQPLNPGLIYYPRALIGFDSFLNSYTNDYFQTAIEQIPECVNSTGWFDQQKFLIFPNPCSNQLNIHTEIDLGLTNFSLISSTGQIIKQWKNEEMIQILDLSQMNLANGLYLICIQTNDGNFIRKKFICMN